MRKKDIVAMLQEDYKLTKITATGIFNSFIDIMIEELSNGSTVDLAEFGRFTVRLSAERKGRNPHTGKVIQIPEKLRVHFKAKKNLLEIINGRKA